MIQVDNLSKSYGKKMALDHITASIHDEHIFGLLGTNGAGKSTFLKILSGILKPDSGTVIIDDHPVFENELTKADICFLSDNPYFFPNATPHTMAHYYSLAYSQFDTIRFEELARQFHIDIQEKISDFSKGMKVKLAFAVALSHKAELLILDEATSGLDPIIRDDVLDMLIDFVQDENHSVLVSSHITSDLEKVADYITFIHKGKLVFSHDKDDLVDNYGIVSCGSVIFDTLDKTDTIAYRKEDYQYKVLVRNRNKAAKNYPKAIVSPATIEEIMLFYVKGELQ